MNPRQRSLWVAIGTTLYVGFASLQAGGGPLPWFALLILPLVLAEAWRRTGSPTAGQDPYGELGRRVIRAVVWGTALWLAARSGPTGRPAFDAIANLGSGVAAVGCLVALARLEGTRGVFRPSPAARSLDAAIFMALLWSIAVAFPATRALLPAKLVQVDPLAIDYATTTAGIGNLLVLIAASLRLKLLRRLELGVGDRAGGALALSVTAAAVAIPAAALDVASPDRVLPIAALAAALLCTWTATTIEPTSVSSALRAILAVTILGVPVALLSGLLARALPEQRGAIVLGSSGLSVLVGLIARAVARPFGPEQSRWLDAVQTASESALLPEPEEALRAALVALGRASTVPTAKPQIWRSAPAEVLSVDIAGYLHVEKSVAPEALYEFALAEPERTLRAEVLQAVQVRRPEVRPLLSWFDSQRAFSATLVVDNDGPLGFILLPRANRSSVMTLEEARAVRGLADRITALLAVSSALARSRERELQAIARADRADDECQRLEHIIFQQAGRNRIPADRAAYRVRSTAHGPASRLALQHIERLGRQHAYLSFLAPTGVDPLGWAAVAHLESPRADGPFLVIDGAFGQAHELALWEDESRSPLAFSDGGTLVILRASALPKNVQDYIARRLSRRTHSTASSSILPAGVYVCVSEPGGPAEPRLSDPLERWVKDAQVKLPALKDRAEDLRSLSLAELAAIGLELHGEPMGLEPAALRLLTEHTWPENELELSALLLKAAGLCEGRVLTAAALLACGLKPEIPGLPARSPAPPPVRHRSRSRRPPRNV